MDLSHCRVSHPLYRLWWYLQGRRLYKRAHGHDWHAATGIYPWWERPWL